MFGNPQILPFWMFIQRPKHPKDLNVWMFGNQKKECLGCLDLLIVSFGAAREMFGNVLKCLGRLDLLVVSCWDV